MGKEKYYYNKQTLQYEKHKVPLRNVLIIIFGFISSTIVSGMLFSYAYFQFFPNPHQQAQARELAQMEYKYSLLSDKIALMDDALNNMHERDASIHRVIFGIEPMDENVWNGGIGGTDHYSDVLDYNNTGQLIKQSEEKVRKLARQIALESKSLDTIQKLAIEKEDRLAAIPSIKPVREDKIKRSIKNLSGFGRRRHPIHKVMRMHSGIDFPAKSGTAIQATGAGVVIKAIKKKSGYGIHVVIDHGYGYTTLYGHMSQINVKKGQKVTKGQIIGQVGNTGTSTGEHLHYEVRFNNRPINPIDFILDGLTPMEYQQLVNASSVTNQSFD